MSPSSQTRMLFIHLHVNNQTQNQQTIWQHSNVVNAFDCNKPGHRCRAWSQQVSLFPPTAAQMPLEVSGWGPQTNKPFHRSGVTPKGGSHLLRATYQSCPALSHSVA